MTTTDDILALAAHATPTEHAAADLIAFAAAVTGGMNTDVVRALRALRPGSLPDSPAWRAWLLATAAMAATSAATGGADMSAFAGRQAADPDGQAAAVAFLPEAVGPVHFLADVGRDCLVEIRLRRGERVARRIGAAFRE